MVGQTFIFESNPTRETSVQTPSNTFLDQNLDPLVCWLGQNSIKGTGSTHLLILVLKFVSTWTVWGR